MQSNARISGGIRWVILSGLLLIFIQSTQRLPEYVVDEFRFVMSSDYVMPISVNNVVLSISLREILYYMRWLPLAILSVVPLWLAVQKREIPRVLKRADASIIVFLVYILISCVFSIDPNTSIQKVFSVFLMYGAVFWGIWIYADEFGIEEIINIIITAAMILFGLHIINAVVDPLGSFPYLGRFQGWTVNPGIAAAHASLLLPLALWIALQKSRWQYWLLVGSMLFVLILSQARTELVAAAIGSMYFLVRTYPKRIYISLVGTISVLTMSYMWIEVGPRLFPQGTEFSLDHIGDTLFANNLDSGEMHSTSTSWSNELGTPELWYDRFNPRLSNVKTLAHRTDKWRLGLEYFLERPLQGFGFGTEDQLFSYHDVNPQDYQLSGTYMHNSYLGLVLQVGVIGAALFYVPLASLLFYELFTTRKTRKKPLLTALLSVVITCMVAAIFSSDLYSMGNPKSIVFWTSVMLLVRDYNKSKDISIDI
jgi:hypothetical protein